MGARSGWEFFCALLLYPMSVIDTHLKLKFIQLKSMDGKSIQCHLGLGLGKVIVNLNHGLIGTSASSSPVLHLLPISSSPVLLLLPISGSSSSLPSSFVFFFGTRVEFHVAKPCPSQQSELESLKLNFSTELEPLSLEMLFSSFISNSC